jgi:UDP-N-acetyl-D-galactosamine dehydrogenase
MNERIAIVGLGYVGLPVALAFARRFEDVVGFDINPDRIARLKDGVDDTGEVAGEDLARSAIRFSCDPADLAGTTFFVVAVPTPIDDHRRPDLRALLSACRTVGAALQPGAVVVFESTVYPGVTEEICGPALEAASGLKAGVDFKLGYSPERINPGDREHTLERVVKVVSGQDPETAERVARCYGAIVDAGVHLAPSIKVAEAAKVIENTQRDLNIALMNELALIFDRLGIRTKDVLAAAGTKWNFLPFTPGLVGGHCIGVDPYYLTAKAEAVGYHPQVILAGRRLNDDMGAFIAQKLVKLLVNAGHPVKGCPVAILGLTFKENVPDLRNSRVPDIVRELREFGVEPRVHDPLASKAEAMHEYGIELLPLDALKDSRAVILAVPHREYLADGGRSILGCLNGSGVIIDVKSALDPGLVRDGTVYWSL